MKILVIEHNNFIFTAESYEKIVEYEKHKSIMFGAKNRKIKELFLEIIDSKHDIDRNINIINQIDVDGVYNFISDDILKTSITLYKRKNFYSVDMIYGNWDKIHISFPNMKEALKFIEHCWKCRMRITLDCIDSYYSEKIE